MKREDWKKVYAPVGDGLDIRVRNTLAALEEKPVAAVRGRRVWAVCMVAALMLVSAAALAAGLMFSDRADVMTAARQALQEQRGFTPEMETFFKPEVQDDGRTVVFSGFDTGFDERIGVYTVTIDGRKATVSWSHDGETIGTDTASRIWDTALLGEAIARRIAGEDWGEIMYAPEELAVNVTQEEALEIARQAIAQKYGADVLEGCEGEAYIFYDNAEAAIQAGHSIAYYYVRFADGSDPDVYRWYRVQLCADDGTVMTCEGGEEKIEPVSDPSGELSDVVYDVDPQAEQAKALAQIAPEEAISLAKSAVAETYGLTDAQAQKLDHIEEYDFCMYSMREDGVPVMTVYLWLWQEDGDNAPFTDGDGMYIVDVNAQTGVIEQVVYDSTLAGNG